MNITHACLIAFNLLALVTSICWFQLTKASRHVDNPSLSDAARQKAASDRSMYQIVTCIFGVMALPFGLCALLAIRLHP